MKKAKNILLLAGICAYVFNGIFKFLRTAPNIKDGLSSYVITGAMITTLSVLLFVTLPVILLVLNLKNKYSKVFTVIVVTLSALSSAYLLIDPYLRAIPEYLILSKLGLIDTILVYFLPSSGILSLTSSIVITVGAILSIKKQKSGD